MPLKEVAFSPVFYVSRYTVGKCNFLEQDVSHTGSAPWTAMIRNHILPLFMIVHHAIRENPDVVMLLVLFSVPEIANYAK